MDPAPSVVQFDMCARATAFGVAEAGRISGEIIKRLIEFPSPFRDRVEKDTFQLGVGYTNTYRTYNPRVFEAQSDNEMTPWNSGDGTLNPDGYPGTSGCAVDLQEVPLLGIKDRVFGLSEKGFRTPLFCAFDLSTKQAADELLTAYYDMLGMNSGYFVERNIQNAYTAIARHKIICNSDQPSNATDGALTGVLDSNGHTIFPAIAPNSILMQGMLDNIKVRLSYQISSAPNMMKTAGSMIYDLLTDDLTSTSLVMQSAGVLPNYQFAYQGAKQGSPLIQGVGAFQGMQVNGFRHLYIKYPARWDLVNGQWIRIRPFSVEPIDPNAPQEVTQEYLMAPFQDSYIFLTNIMKMVVQKAVPRVGPAHFGTPIKDYAGGDWQWFGNPGVQGCNIEGTNGFWWTVVPLRLQGDRSSVRLHHAPSPLRSAGGNL